MQGISVVIPTYNSSRTLDRCLDSIDKQSRRPEETIVVDRCSTDGTIQIAKMHGTRVLESPETRSVARNLGARASHSFGVLFVDSDMILTPELVEESARALLHHDSLIIPEASIGTGFWAICKRIERQASRGSDLLEAPRCYRRESFLAIGGYDEDLEAGEDWELRDRTERNGLYLGRTQSMLLHDEGEYTPSKAFRRKYAYGRTISRYLKRNPSASLVQVNPFIRILDPSVRIMSYDLRHGLGVLLLRSLEFTAAGMGFLERKIKGSTGSPQKESVSMNNDSWTADADRNRGTQRNRFN